MPQHAHENIALEFRGEINIMKNRKATNADNAYKVTIHHPILRPHCKH
jgi:hypothetical protein